MCLYFIKNDVHCYMKDIHIGNLIGLRLKQLGMTKAEFSRRINRSPQNIHDLLSRESVDTNLLLKISEVLNYNFFKVFMPKNEVKKELSSKNIFIDKEFSS